MFPKGGEVALKTAQDTARRLKSWGFNTVGGYSDLSIIKQKMPTNNGGYKALASKENPYGKISELVYTELTTDHPIDLTRYQVANCYMGRAGLINSGGDLDFEQGGLATLT